MEPKFRNRLLSHLLARASHDLSRKYLQVVRERGFTARQWRLLGCLWDEKSLTLTELSQVIFCGQSTTTRLVDRLHELGLLEKRVDAIDRRKFYVSLTKKGRESISDLVEFADATEREIIQTLGANRVTRIMRDMLEITKRFGNAADQDHED
jgi:DNA-binding MarR family transcriptional regulator